MHARRITEVRSMFRTTVLAGLFKFGFIHARA